MPTPPQLTPEQRKALADAIYAGRKLEAIKQLREVSGLGLKESKDIVDKLETELRAEHPERFTSKASRGGCASVLLLVAVVVAVVVFFLQR